MKSLIRRILGDHTGVCFWYLAYSLLRTCGGPQSSSFANHFCTSASASLGLSYGTYKHSCQHHGPQVTSSRLHTHHMSSPIDSSKRQPISAPRLTDHLPINFPFSQWLAYERLLASPGHLERPTLVSDPITGPVVRPDIDECAYATFEELSNVGVRLMERVLSAVERIEDIVVAEVEL